MSFAKNSIVYLKMFAKNFLKHPSPRTLITGLKYYPAWLRHLAPGQNSVAGKLPWICFSAIAFLKKIASPGMRVFEYGSGGSTLFWVSRVKDVVSVEHDKPWFDRMKTELDRLKIDNIRYLLAEAGADRDFMHKDYLVPEAYISSDPHYTGMNFEKYVRTIDGYADEYFDIVIVDGRCRASCILHSLPKIKKGGWLVVDNSEREYYLSPFQFEKENWSVHVFSGPVPFSPGFSETTVIKKLS